MLLGNFIESGGRQINNDDLNYLQQEIFYAVQNQYSGSGAFILNGCNVAGSNIGSGLVYIDGLILKFNGATSVTFPCYIHQATPVNQDSFPLELGGTAYKRTLYISELVNSIPSSGEYITMTSSGGRTYNDVLANSFVRLSGNQTIAGTKTFSSSINASNNKVINVASGTSNNDVVIYKQLSSEVTNRTNADTTLQNNINTVTSNLSTETSTRSNADNTLQSNINTVSSNLSTETTNRTNADSTLQSNINTVASNLSTETTNRTNADANLQNQINTLVLHPKNNPINFVQWTMSAGSTAWQSYRSNSSSGTDFYLNTVSPLSNSTTGNIAVDSNYYHHLRINLWQSNDDAVSYSNITTYRIRVVNANTGTQINEWNLKTTNVFSPFNDPSRPTVVPIDFINYDSIGYNVPVYYYIHCANTTQDGSTYVNTPNWYYGINNYSITFDRKNS